MIDVLYYDNFADCVVTADELEDIAPPERYIRVYCGSDVFIEKWRVDNSMYLNVAYTTFERKSGLVYDIRKAMAEKNNVSLTYMVDWTVPKEHWEKMLKSMEE